MAIEQIPPTSFDLYKNASPIDLKQVLSKLCQKTLEFYRVGIQKKDGECYHPLIGVLTVLNQIGMNLNNGPLEGNTTNAITKLETLGPNHLNEIPEPLFKGISSQSFAKFSDTALASAMQSSFKATPNDLEGWVKTPSVYYQNIDQYSWGLIVLSECFPETSTIGANLGTLGANLRTVLDGSHVNLPDWIADLDKELKQL